MKIKKTNEDIFQPKFPWADQPVTKEFHARSKPENPKDAYEDSENPVDEFPNDVWSHGPDLGKGKLVYEPFTKLYTIKTIDNYKAKYG